MGQLLYAKAIHTTKQAQIDGARITQASGNEKRGAVSELGRFSQSLANRRIMDAAGKEVGTITENLGRNLDAAATGKFSSRIAAAEEMGANMAAASAAGVGGSTMDIFANTLRLSQAMQEEQGDRQVNSENIAASRSRGDTVTSAVASLGNDVISADMDYTQYVDHHEQGMFSRLTTFAAAAAATYFGGPQAGQAVLTLNDSGQAARNGDFATASNKLTAALDGGIKGARAYQAGGAWGAKAYSDVRSAGAKLHI